MSFQSAASPSLQVFRLHGQLIWGPRQWAMCTDASAGGTPNVGPGYLLPLLLVLLRLSPLPGNVTFVTFYLRPSAFCLRHHLNLICVIHPLSTNSLLDFPIASPACCGWIFILTRRPLIEQLANNNTKQVNNTCLLGIPTQHPPTSITPTHTPTPTYSVSTFCNNRSSESDVPAARVGPATPTRLFP